MGIDIGRDYIWLDAVALNVLRDPGMFDRIEQAEQGAGPIPVPLSGIGHGQPERRMRVLAPVFAYARRVAFDIAGIIRCPVEWRPEQRGDPVLPTDEMYAPPPATPGRPVRDRRPRK